jgi:O-antigen ligase
VLLLVAGLFAGVLYLKLPLEQFAFVALLLTTATYRGIFFVLRVDAPGIALGIFDCIWLAVAFKIGLRWALNSRQSVLIPWVAFLTSIFLTVVVGLANAQPLYNIVKLFRTELFLLAGISLGLSLTQDARLVALRAIVIGGTITSLAQIATFLFALQGIQLWSLLGISATDSATYFEANSGQSSAFRDNGVAIIFSMASVIILFASLALDFTLFRRLFTLGMLYTSMLGILLSLTRSIWLGVALGVVLVMLQARNLKLVRILGWIGSLLILASAMILIGSMSPSLDVVDQLFESRLSSLGSGLSDATTSDRIAESRAALRELGSQLLFGVGAADVDFDSAAVGGRGSEVVRNQLHNGYVQYLLGGGVIGLMTLIWLVLSCALPGLRTAITSRDDRDTFIAVSAITVVAIYCLTALIGGVVNDSLLTPVLGVLLGISWTYRLARADENRSLGEVMRYERT